MIGSISKPDIAKGYWLRMERHFIVFQNEKMDDSQVNR